MLNSIGDAVVGTDTKGLIMFINAKSEELTGWSRQEAVGRQIEDVMVIVDADTHAAVPSPVFQAIRSNETVALQNNCVLIRIDGVETAIEDSTAPIHDLAGRVTGAIMVFHDVSVARDRANRISHAAHHDALTGLPNSRLMNDLIKQSISLARRNGNALAVLFVDIDGFKEVNDVLGHMAGDVLLQSVAERLVCSVRSSDTVSRRGGDEFVILLSELARAKDAAMCAKKILEELCRPHCVGGRVVEITASIGVAIFPEGGGDAMTIVDNADYAMYCAKRNGRNHYEFFTNAKRSQWSAGNSGN